MSKNPGCKRLKLSCTKLKSKCNSKLGAALGNSNLGKICKKALKGKAQKRVNEYCQKTCRKCGKLSNDYYVNTVKEFLIIFSFSILSIKKSILYNSGDKS